MSERGASLFFLASKLFWFVMAPSHLLLWLVIGSAALLWMRRMRLGRHVALAAAALFLLIGVLPIGRWLIRPLEDQYPRPPWPAHVDGVVTLGGGLSARTLASRGALGQDAGEARIVSAYEIARRYPSAKVVFAGGWGRYADAYAARTMFNQLGLDPHRLLLDAKSRNTYENLLFAERLARPRPGEVWILATSAVQLPRAMAVARRLGWNLTAWPTDYLTSGGRGPALPSDINVPGNLQHIDAAVHEWIGLLAYDAAQMAGGRKRA